MSSHINTVKVERDLYLSREEMTDIAKYFLKNVKRCICLNQIEGKKGTFCTRSPVLCQQSLPSLMVNLSDHVSARVNGQNRITQKRNFDKLEFNVGFFIYFFPQRTKPRGVIDLGYASVYTVHESLFNQPNCFQIVVKVTNDMEVYYLNAETQQLSEVMLQFIYQSMYDVES